MWQQQQNRETKGLLLLPTISLPVTIISQALSTGTLYVHKFSLNSCVSSSPRYFNNRNRWSLLRLHFHATSIDCEPSPASQLIATWMADKSHNWIVPFDSFNRNGVPGPYRTAPRANFARSPIATKRDAQRFEPRLGHCQFATRRSAKRWERRPCQVRSTGRSHARGECTTVSCS